MKEIKRKLDCKSSAELGRFLGVSPTTFWRLENTKKLPKKYLIIKILLDEMTASQLEICRKKIEKLK